MDARIAEELRIARAIQLSLLPACPVATGWTFSATYQAAREMSGDFYDFLFHAMPEGRLELVIGDVTGKGVAAALMMAHSRAVLRAQAVHANGPAELLMNTNRTLTEDSQTRLFLSALYARIELASGVVTYANAGHDRPLLLRRSSAAAAELDAPGIILGAFADISLEDCVVQLAKGDTLIFFTDGVTEARDTAGELFGDERLAAAALSATSAGGDANAVSRSIMRTIQEFSDGTAQADDLTLVILQRRPD